MTYGKQLLQYQKTNIETSSGVDLIVMCYEHAIRFLKQAKEHYERKEYIEKGKSLQRALDIIAELKLSLDFERGGEIARNLESIYNFLIKTLLEADINRKLQDFDNAVTILEELKNAWVNIPKNGMEQKGKEAEGKLDTEATASIKLHAGGAA